MKIEHYVHREAERLIRRFERQKTAAKLESKARQERSTSKISDLEVRRPAWWDVDPAFDPYVVRRNAGSIGHAIWGALQRGEYSPRPPLLHEIPKGDDNTRVVSIFQVADSAISKMVFESVLKKNASRISGNSYAYRQDLSAQDAVLAVKSAWAGKKRVFVAEFDFTAFFDAISHAHLDRMLDERAMFFNKTELQVARAFMSLRPVAAAEYPGAQPPSPVGIPQGTSISLVLANLAASELDKRLEKLGVEFVRYADDTLIWSDTYEEACEAFLVLSEAAVSMGVELNQKKASGISLLVPDRWPDGEIRTKRNVRFLGYEIGLDRCAPHPASIERIRADCSNLVYDHLLREPLAGTQKISRLTGNVDRDYVRLLSQLRRYMYGDLSEKQVSAFQRGEVPLRHFRGALAAFPLMDDGQYLVDLDRWLVQMIHSALHKRRKLLEKACPALPVPHGLNHSDLLAAGAVSSRGAQLDLKVPSFRRISRAMRHAADEHGPAAVGAEPTFGVSNPFSDRADFLVAPPVS